MKVPFLKVLPPAATVFALALSPAAHADPVAHFDFISHAPDSDA